MRDRYRRSGAAEIEAAARAGRGEGRGGGHEGGGDCSRQNSNRAQYTRRKQSREDDDDGRVTRGGPAELTDIMSVSTKHRRQAIAIIARRKASRVRASDLISIGTAAALHERTSLLGRGRRDKGLPAIPIYVSLSF